MALIREFVRIEKETNHVHGTVECGWTTFEQDGKPYVQLDTYGSGERQEPGKVSQSIQLGESAAAELSRILVGAFPAISQHSG